MDLRELTPCEHEIFALAAPVWRIATSPANPGLTTEQLESGYTEVNVGVRENAECGEATPTYGASASSGGCTPQAGP